MIPQRILVRGVNWLGDAVMTTPALVRLRERYPTSSITLLTHAKLAGLWHRHPAVDSVLTFDRSDGVWGVARRLRSHRFDAAFLFPNSPRSALEAFLARIPRRIGGTWPWRDWLLTDVVPAQSGSVPMRRRSVREIVAAQSDSLAPPHWGEPLPGPAAHHIHQYLRLVGGEGAPSAPIIGVDPEVMLAVSDRFGLESSRRWIGINAGAEYGPAKRWPAEHFRSVIAAVLARPGMGVLVFGGGSDVDLARSLCPAEGPNCKVLAGRTSLAELAAALKRCVVVVTNDTGPMHLAAAVGTPVVVPFGSTSPQLTGPGLPGDARHVLIQAEVPCGPCFLRVCPADFRCLGKFLRASPGGIGEARMAGMMGLSGCVKAMQRRHFLRETVRMAA